MPPSQLDGREPVETTEHEYADGLLIRSVTTREPRWTEQDRAEVIALGRYRASLCPCGCGHKSADTTAHEDGGPQFVPVQSTCNARMSLLAAQRAANEDRGTDNAPARLWRVDMKGR